MKFIKRKIYWNYEKEERWLNKQAALGFALTDYSWCRYVFEESEPGEYIYRLELLENPAADMESQRYIRFMEENGVEHVASFNHWVYFRRKSTEGAFDIYSDIDSRIRHGARVFKLWLWLAVMETAIGICNIAIYIINNMAGIYSPAIEFNLAAGCVVFAVGLAFLILAAHAGRKLARMKRDRVLTE